MKRTPFLLFVSVLSFSTLTTTEAQFSLVTSMGISPQQKPGNDYIFVNRSTPKAEFTFAIAQVKASYFIGGGTRYDLKPFFFMAEAQYNKREFVYDVEYTYPAFGRSDESVEYNETMHVINLPLSIGVQLGAVEMISGFLPQLVVAQESGLESLSGYSQILNPLRFGWHTGIAARIAALHIGLDWQMDANSYGEHIYINGQNLDLNGKSSRVVGSLTYQF